MTFSNSNAVWKKNKTRKLVLKKNGVVDSLLAADREVRGKVLLSELRQSDVFQRVLACMVIAMKRNAHKDGFTLSL